MAEHQEISGLSPEERQAIILKKVNGSGRVLAAALAQDFNVSEDSIRRDLRDLSDAGLVQRFHGGASRLVKPALDFHRRERLTVGDKQSIGRAAAAVIPDGATLLVDSSTTVVQFVRNLSPSLHVRIITPALDIAAAALDHPLAEVIMVGGSLGRLTRGVSGITAYNAIRSLRADFCILGTCGVDDDLFLRADDFEDASLKDAMIKASNKTVLLATEEKIGHAATHRVCPISVVSTLFTNSHDNAFLDRIRELGVDVETV